MDNFDKDYFRESIYQEMQVDYPQGSVSAFGWIKAKVNTQTVCNQIKPNFVSDSEVLAEIKMIIEAYKEADKQYAIELEERLS